MPNFFSGAFGGIVEDLKAQAQTYVGQMLINRGILLQIQDTSSNPSTAQAAAQLLVTQGDLEVQLGQVNTKINSEDLSIPDYASILSFFYSVSNHNSAVDDLNKIYTIETGRSAGPSATSTLPMNLLWIGAAAVAVIAGVSYFKRR
jgi:hypothetical protein